MTYNLQKSEEKRRYTLISILLAFSSEEESLKKLSNTELEHEFNNLKSTNHPHSNTGAIKWITKYY
ncbi:hypothetical protein JOC77_000972 [Peribacillus deserti]|uniref:Fur-regulated basic protein FbpA n=1 Tax=Peribacillus deserti TaxID=673318 RepID=A0ABS2QEJ0_9BACI|nr:Fur-regulated basic protein FbpA [Peribacillus deserti]MBM7691565.1 hypothetical protein [Peribacillus deserti]